MRGPTGRNDRLDGDTMKSQKQFTPVFSFEFFPPKNEQGQKRLERTRRILTALEPRFFSVTFGAGGSTRERTFETVKDVMRETGIDTAPHLSCVSSTRDGIRDILNRYIRDGVKQIVALRGDLPEGMESPGELNYANELVEFIRQETGDHFYIEVGCYPEIHPAAASAREDLDHFAAKVRAGADSAMTQYFFARDAYYRFVEECEARGLDIPIVPGIMPITNYTQLARFSDTCGADIPRWIRKRLEDYNDKDDMESLRAFGEEVVTRMCQDLLDAGAPGLHFYTLNQAEPSLALWRNLGLPNVERAQQVADELSG